ncbi:MAG: hypothetical protein DA407_04950 [Bacteroidetes bacterium]|nr:MAG: hypothetical protein DA407_04950 [Bacteroidota bacterium]
MKKALLILILMSCFLKVTAQHSINDYKYVIVEKQFHFQTEPNQYNLNELTRFLLKKNGFRPILESDIFPNDLKSNYCLALNAEVKASGFLRTTVTITLTDCNNNVMFEAESTNKEKEFDKAYSYGIRMAFEDFKVLKYNYVPNEAIVNKADTEIIDASKDDSVEVEKLKAEIEELKKVKEVKKTKLEENTTKELKGNSNAKKDVVKEIVKKESPSLEAVAIDNGYNLIDIDSKKIVHVLVKTGMDNVFTVKNNSGIVYKKDGKWVREYTKENNTVVEILNVDF